MRFDFQPTIKGASVELRPLRPDDADDLFAVDPHLRSEDLRSHCEEGLNCARVAHQVEHECGVKDRPTQAQASHSALACGPAYYTPHNPTEFIAINELRDCAPHILP